MAQKIEVVVKATGRKQWVPEHYLDHPVLSQPFRQTPSQAAAAAAEERRLAGPDESWKIAELREYAEPLGIDLTGLRKHADILDAVLAGVPQTPASSDAGDPGHNADDTQE